MSLDAQKVMELKGFVGLMKQNPQLLHEPSLSFFKDFIESMGGKIPAKAAAAAGGSSGGEASPKAASPKASKKPEPKIVEVESEEDEDPAEIEEYVDTEEDPKKLEEESDEPPAMGPEGEVELTDDQQDAQNAAKGEAAEAIEDGDNKKAIECMTKAIAVGGATAMMYSKRADLLLKEKKPKAAILDAEAALKLNPESAKAHKVKGLASRYLHRWADAHKHIAEAMAIDYDDSLEDAQAFVKTRWVEMQKVETAKRNRADEMKVKNQKKLRKQRKEEHEKAKAEQAKRDAEREAEMMGGMGGMPGGMGGMGGKGFPGGKGGMPDMGGMGGKGGMGGMPPGMEGLFSDPELMQAMQNPKVMACMSEMLQDPTGAMAKYQDDPEVMSVMTKLMGKMGGGKGGMPDMGGMGGMGGGMPGGMGGKGGMPDLGAMFGGKGGMPDMSSMFGGKGGMGGGAPPPGNVEECD